MEELNELEQQEMEVETTEEPVDEYDIEEVESSDLPEPDEEETEISKATVALAISAGVAIGAGLYRGFKYLKANAVTKKSRNQLLEKD